MTVMPRDRTLADEIEVARRVNTYTRQVSEFGHIMWLPNVMKPVSRGSSNEARQEEDD